jgi:hypothetical protein
MDDERRVAPGKPFEYCETCDYKGGFHVLLDVTGQREPCEAKLKLKCPNCFATYDLNLYCTVK